MNLQWQRSHPAVYATHVHVMCAHALQACVRKAYTPKTSGCPGRAHVYWQGLSAESCVVCVGLGCDSITSSDVCMPLISSTSFITGTGFMKCMPTWTAVQKAGLQQCNEKLKVGHKVQHCCAALDFIRLHDLSNQTCSSKCCVRWNEGESHSTCASKVYCQIARMYTWSLGSKWRTTC